MPERGMCQKHELWEAPRKTEIRLRGGGSIRSCALQLGFHFRATVYGRDGLDQQCRRCYRNRSQRVWRQLRPNIAPLPPSKMDGPEIAVRAPMAVPIGLDEHCFPPKVSPRKSLFTDRTVNTVNPNDHSFQPRQGAERQPARGPFLFQNDETGYPDKYPCSRPFRCGRSEIRSL